MAGVERLKGLNDFLNPWNLAATKVTDPGLAHLKGSPQLHSLTLNWTHVTDAGLAPISRLTHSSTSR